MKRSFIGTHHKCGTVWVDQIYKLFTDVLCIPYTHITENTNYDNYGIYFSPHSDFVNFITTDDCVIHVIRDPRDVCISGARYHTTDYAISSESWLSDFVVPGVPYWEFLRTLDFKQQLIAEYEHVTVYTVEEIFKLRNIDGVLTIRYEDLISESRVVETVARMSEEMDLNGYESMALLGCAISKHRYFGSAHIPEHMTSSGRPQLWRTLTYELQDILEERLGQAARSLGYE